ncbi:hypothetical protein [Algibacter lectus]|uniref:hypothetical protein n=1 Tax=Algibacter lectus TaxID=221126 RepID=UPI0026F035E2|nr:hypothetical protein [Algibacter lectus]MDO7135437.1 hypothetical protein [Algibacter lectus]
MTEINIKKIIDSAVNGNEFPFNRFFEDTFKKLLPKLTALTNSRDDAQDVFITSMHKFWERFVIKQEELPLNSIAYIYMMCRNAWLHKKRQPWNSVILVDNNAYNLNKAKNDILVTEQEKIDLENDISLKHKALSIAINELCDKCKKLIEAELDNNIKLKDLQQEMGYNNYQALVQAKYNCKKRLVKKVTEALINLKKNNS